MRPQAARFNRSAVCCSVRWVAGQGSQITQGVPPSRFDAPESPRRRPRPRHPRARGSESQGFCRSSGNGQETKAKNERLPVLRRRRSPKADIERDAAAGVCARSRRSTLLHRLSIFQRTPATTTLSARRRACESQAVSISAGAPNHRASPTSTQRAPESARIIMRHNT